MEIFNTIEFMSIWCTSSKVDINSIYCREKFDFCIIHENFIRDIHFHRIIIWNRKNVISKLFQTEGVAMWWNNAPILHIHKCRKYHSELKKGIFHSTMTKRYANFWKQWKILTQKWYERIISHINCLKFLSALAIQIAVLL